MSIEVTIPDLPLADSPIPQSALLEISNSGVSEKATIAQVVASGQTPWTQNIQASNFQLLNAGNVQTDQIEIINQGAGDNPTLTSNSALDVLEFSGNIEIDGGSIHFGNHVTNNGWIVTGAGNDLHLFPPLAISNGVRQFEITSTSPIGTYFITMEVANSNNELFWNTIAQGVTTVDPAITHIAEVPGANDSGTAPITSFVSRRNVGFDLTARTLFEWFNNTTSVLSIDAAGVVAFPQSPDIDDFTNSLHDHSDDVNGGQISLSAIALVSAQIIVGNVSGDAAAVSMSGDATIDNTGALTITDDAVTLAKIATGTPGGLIGYDLSGNPTDVAQGTSGQILTSNGTGLATFEDAAVSGIVTINSDGTAAQVLSPTANRITIVDAGANHTFDVGTDVVTITASNIFGAFLQDFVLSNLRIPFSTTPTIAVDGDIGIDSDVTDFTGGVLEYFSGINIFGVVAMPITEFTTPTDGDVITYVAASNSFELTTIAGFSGNLSDLTINTDKNWLGFSITSLGLLNLRILNTTAVLELEADHTAPANGQIIGQLDFIDDNISGTRITYGEIRTVIEDNTATFESAEMFFSIRDGSGTGFVDYIKFNNANSNQVQIGATLNLDSNNIINSGTINSIIIPATGDNFLTDTAVQDITSKTFLASSVNKFEDQALVIQNPGGTFDYIVNSAAIAAAIAISLPLLTANDTFVFEAFIQNLTNKTLDNTNSIAADAIDSGTLDNARLSAQVVLTSQTNVYGTFLQNFVGASLRIPTSNSPTITVNGDFAFDDAETAFAGGLIKFFITEEQAIVAMAIAEFTDPAEGAIPTYNTGTNQFEMVVPTEFGDVSSVGAVDALSIAVFTDAAGKTIDEGGTTLHPSISSGGQIIAPAPINFTSFLGTLPGTGDEFIVNVTNNLIIHANSQVTLRVSGADEIQVTSANVTLPDNNLVLTAGDITVTAGALNMTDGNIVFADTDQKIIDIHQITFNGATQTGAIADAAALNLEEGDYITWEGAIAATPNFIRFTTGDIYNIGIAALVVVSISSNTLQLASAGMNVTNITTLGFLDGGNSTIGGITGDLGIQMDLDNNDVFRILENSTIEYEFDDTQLALNGNGLEDAGMINCAEPATALTVTTLTITVTQTYHTVDTSVAAQNIETINGGTAGDFLVLQTNNINDLDVDEGGNIQLGSGTRVLSDPDDLILLFYDGNNWLELSYANNS